MNDVAHEYTDKEIEKLDKNIQSVYSEAQRDIEKKLDDFTKKSSTKANIKYQEMLDGKITKNEYTNWMRGQVFQTKQWKAKREQIIDIINNSNNIAANIINGRMQNVFAENATYMNYSLEHTAGVNFGFGVYDNATMAKLLKDEPQTLPKWKINKQKDYIWNKKKVNNAITQGIIQGKKLDQISKDISEKLVMQNKNLSKTFARTAMTEAQNAGRVESLKSARKLGIDVNKEWMATLDHHTRDSHAELDGESIPEDEEFSNGLRYPGDPNGEASEIYNCRCTMVGDLKKYPAEYERYDNIDGFPIRNMSYKEWRENKFEQKHKSARDFVWDKHYSGTPNRKYGKVNTADAMWEMSHGKSNSLSAYLDRDGNLSPEREALHKQIIDNYLNGKTPQQGTATMTMMGGGPASGKSSVIKSGLYKLPDKKCSVVVDPDDIKQYLPGYAQMSKLNNTAASFYHEESSMLAKQLASTCFTENYNVTYDGTGDGSINSVMKKLNGAKKYGYRVNGMYVTVDIDEALKRNMNRYKHALTKGESPRLVPDDYVISCHKKVTQISMETSDKFDSIKLYDNNGKSGNAKLIAIGGNGGKLHAIKGEEKTFKKFLGKVNYSKTN